MKKYIWGIIYGTLLTAFTLYILMDTFVIPRVYSDAPPPSPTPTVSTAPNPNPALITDSIYCDENITITLTKYRQYDTSIYVADVLVSSPEYLKTALANDSYGRNITAKTSEIAQSKQAILAINGDYYGSQENGYVLRNGVLYRQTAVRG